MKKQKCTLCGNPSIPGLLAGSGKCQYHYNVKQFGKEWADKVAADKVAAERKGKQLNDVVDGYLEAAAFADCPEGSRARFPKSERTKAEKVCKEFVDACGPLFEQALNVDGYSAAQFGRDFWFTRAGHGVGYWDRPELEIPAACNVPFLDRDNIQYRAGIVDCMCELGEMLSACAYGTSNHISKFAYPSVSVYRGWMYIE